MINSKKAMGVTMAMAAAGMLSTTSPVMAAESSA